MSVILIRPVCPEGKLPSTDWDYDAAEDYAGWDDWDTADIVDAADIIRNWLIIVDHVNGNLNGSDLTEGVVALSETTFILDEEESGEVWPTTHQRHSHDGYDSAPLGADVITSALMQAMGFGALRHPASDDYALLMHGSLTLDFIGDVIDLATVRMPISFPYDWYFWDSGGSGLLHYATDGTTRFIGSPVIPDFLNWSAEQKRALFTTVLVSTLYDETFRIVPYATTGTDTIAGWQFAWAVLALV